MTARKTRLRWNWREVWATIGICAATVLIVAALFYGYPH